MTISDARPRGIIKVVKIGGLSCGCGCGCLINLAIKLTGTTSANETGKEDEDKNEGDNANDREHSSNCACIMEETETIVSKSLEEFRKREMTAELHASTGLQQMRSRNMEEPARNTYYAEVGARGTSQATALRKGPVLETSHFAGTTHKMDDRRYTHGVDDRFDWVSVGVPAGTVTTAVCVKTWPSDVWTIKEMLEVKDGFEEGVEEVFVGVEDEDVSPVELDAAALEDGLEDEELAAVVEELDGAVVCGVVVAACEEGVGVGLGVALGPAVEAGGVATGP
jgi:hypothetical protein